MLALAGSGSTGPLDSGGTGPLDSGGTGPLDSGSTGPLDSGSTGPLDSGSTGFLDSGSTGSLDLNPESLCGWTGLKLFWTHILPIKESRSSQESQKSNIILENIFFFWNK